MNYSYHQWTIRTLDCSYSGLFVPSWTVRTMDCSYRGLFVPSWTVHTLDYSYRPWTFRTLDCSYRGLFVPSWTVRTMDYSYHHWTIRTVMQDSQKLTFPTKMCLCSLWVNYPLNFSDIFSKRLGLFSANLTFRLYIPIYAGLRWTTSFYLIICNFDLRLSATNIICSKCPPSAKTHAGWSHLIWYKFVKIGDNWIKICNLP